MVERTVVTVAELQGSAVSLQGQAGVIVGALRDLRVDPMIVERIRLGLLSAADVVGGNGFDRGGRIDETSFGDRDSARGLAGHHARAQQVMADTLQGVTADVAAFAVAVTTAADGLLEADTYAGQDLDKQRAGADSLTQLARRSEGDAAYDQSRNHPVDPRTGER